MPSNRIVFTEDTLSPNLKSFLPRMEAALATYLQFQEGPIQDAMRSGAPWTDRTGNARGGLFATADATGIDLYHTVSYGIWLEVAHDGQYAIIIPSLPVQGARVMAGLSQLFNLMGSA